MLIKKPSGDRAYIFYDEKGPAIRIGFDELSDLLFEEG